MKVTFILSTASHSRYQKRVTAFERFQTECVILAFERRYYAGKPWPNGHISLGRVSHSNYLRRLFPLARSLWLIRRSLVDADVAYVFALDTLFLAWLASRMVRKRTKIVYEVGDIREILVGRSVVSGFLRQAERYLVRRSDRVIVTSQAYIDGYFRGIQELHDVSYHVIENKLDANSLPTPKIELLDSTRPIRVGYFGLIRCRRSLETLVQAAEEAHGNIEVIIRGVPFGLDDFSEYVRSSQYVDYGGPYISPDDLPEVYSMVDVVWIAHYHGRNNLRWSRANRFYEACFFKRPMLAQEGTEDGRVVQQYGLGTCIDLADMTCSVHQLTELNFRQLTDWQRNVISLPSEIYQYTDEHEQLLKALR